MKMCTIHPGVELYHLPFDHYKTVSVTVYLHQPLQAETATENALLLDVLLRGSKTYPSSRELNRYLEELYGAQADAFVSKYGDEQILAFTAGCIADEYVPDHTPLVEKVAEVLHDILCNPLLDDRGFSEEYIAQEKKNLKESLQARINDKRSYASDRCIEEMCQDDPYALFEGGDHTRVAAITNADLVAAYKRILSGPITIFVTGKTDLSIIRNLFADLPERNADYPVGQVFVPKAEPRSVTERMDVTQGKLVMGFSTGIAANSPEYTALRVGNSVFGAGPHSKLFKNVREKLSLAYYAYSRTDRAKGVMLVSAGIEFEKFSAAQDEIMAQLSAVQNGEIDEEALAAAKSAITSTLRAVQDSPAQSVSRMLGNILSHTVCDLEEEVARVNAVTVDQIVAAFKKVRPQMTYFLTGKEA